MAHVPQPVTFVGTIQRARLLSRGRCNDFVLFGDRNNKRKVFAARADELIQYVKPHSVPDHFLF